MRSSNQFILFLLFATTSAIAQTQMIERAYSDLSGVARTIPHRGLSQADKAAVLKDRQVLVGQPRESAFFLIKQLNEINFNEVKGDPKTHNAYQISSSSNDILKIWVCFILADVYHQATAPHEDIAKALAAAYTPAMIEYHQSLTNLLWATLSVGPDSIPLLLQLANTNDIRLRCGIADALQQVSRKLGSEDIHMNCKESRKMWSTDISHWKGWWSSTGVHEPFPNFPNFFDSL